MMQRVLLSGFIACAFGFTSVRVVHADNGAEAGNSLGANPGGMSLVTAAELRLTSRGSGTIAADPAKTSYLPGETLTLTATPGRFYAFAAWSDGNVQNPRSITVGATNEFVAIFTNAVPLELRVAKQWEGTFGGAELDDLKAMKVLPDGSLLLGGTSDSGISGNKAIAGFGANDFWLVKVDPKGNRIWEKVFGGLVQDNFRTMETLDDGSIVLAGSGFSNNDGNRSAPGFGGVDVWLVKLDASGNKIWDKAFGGSQYDDVYAIHALSDGGLLLVGSTLSSADGNKSSPTYGSSDGWLVKVDAEGNKVWDRTFGGSGEDWFTSIQSTRDGGFLLGGVSQSPADGNKAAPALGNADMWLVKVDAGGNKIWDRSYGGTNFDVLNAMAPTSDGGCLLGGVSGSDVGPGRSAPISGLLDYWIVKVDAGGNQLWDKSYGGMSMDELSVIRPLADGGFLLGGSSASGADGNKTALPYGGNDYWVVRIDAQGAKLWDRSFGGTASDSLRAIEPTPDGGFMIGGTSESGIGGNKTSAGFGTADFWALKIVPEEWPVGTPWIEVNGNTLADQSFTSPPVVAIASTFPGANIRYTLDGSMPTAGSTLYTGPFTLSASATLRVVAFDAGGTTSALADSVQINLPPVAQSVVVTGAYKWSTIAGRGMPQHGGGIGNQARFNQPSGLAIDVNGDILVADAGQHSLRRVTRQGVVTTAAGVWINSYGAAGMSTEGPWDSAGIYAPYTVAVDRRGNIFFGNFSHFTIGRLSPDGMVTTIAGQSSTPGLLDELGTKARFGAIVGLAMDSSGTLFISDQGGSVLRKMTSAGIVTTVALSEPLNALAIATDRAGTLYALGEHTLKKITAGGQVTIVAGARGQVGSLDATGGEARFNFSNPYYPLVGLDVDAAGDVYLTDVGNHTIRKVTPDGRVSTIAGTAGVSGTADGVGSTARFKNPAGIVVHPDGNLIVADTGNATIRVIAPDGAVTTLAGLAGFITPDGPGDVARFNGPTGLTVDEGGNVFVADYGNGKIRKIAPDGATSTFAEEGSWFSYPYALARDSQGTFYITETHGGRVLKMTREGVVTTLAGELDQLGYVDGPASTARFGFLGGIAVDTAGNVFVADERNHVIRKITTAGVVSTFAGAAVDLNGDGIFDEGYVDGQGSAARFDRPKDVEFDRTGTLYVVEYTRIRKVTPEGLVSTWVTGLVDAQSLVFDAAGNAFVCQFSGTIVKITPDGVMTPVAGQLYTQSHVDGVGSAARFDRPEGLGVDAAGNLYVADRFNHSIRKITPDGTVSTLAGYKRDSYVDGAGVDARFSYPGGSALDSAGNLYIADTHNHVIRKMTPAGQVRTVAGLAGFQGSADGIGSAARFRLPQDVAVDSSGNLYVADTGNYTIRKITPSGVVTTWAGAAVDLNGDGIPDAWFNDGVGAEARFQSPVGVAVDRVGNVFVSDGHAIRKIAPTREVTTFVGARNQAGNLDGLGSAARFNEPHGIVIDSQDTLFVVDSGTYAIRKITPGGLVTTLTSTFTHDSWLMDVCLDGVGNLYLSDRGHGRVLKVSPAGQITMIGGTRTTSGYTTWHADGLGTSASLLGPHGIEVDASGAVYVIEGSQWAWWGNHDIRMGVPDQSPPATVVSAGLGQGTMVNLGGTVTLSSPVNVGTQPTTYQWLRNGIRIEGATDATHSIYNVRQEDLAAYSVVVSNALGVATSPPAALFVNHPTTFQEFYNLDDNQVPHGWGVNGSDGARITNGFLNTRLGDVRLTKPLSLPGKVVRIQAEWDQPVFATSWAGGSFAAGNASPLAGHQFKSTGSTAFLRPGLGQPDATFDAALQPGTYHQTVVFEPGVMRIKSEAWGTGAVLFDFAVTNRVVDPSFQDLLQFSGFIFQDSAPDGLWLDNLYVRVETVPVLDLHSTGSGTLDKTPDKPTYAYGESVTLTATPARYHEFLQWSDGNTQNPRTIRVGLSNQFTAVFTNAVPLERVPLRQVVVGFPGFAGAYGDQFIRRTPDGGLLMAQSTRSWPAGPTSTAVIQGGNDIVLAKLSANGAFLWDTNFGGVDEDVLGDIKVTQDGGFIVVGSSSSGISGNKTTAGFGEKDVWVFKLNNLGEKEWEYLYGGTGEDLGRAVCQTTDGRFIVAGYSSSTASGNKTSAGQGAWVLALDDLGKKLWETVLGSNSAPGGFHNGDTERADIFTRIVQGPDGNLLLGGRAYSQAGGPGFGYLDFWLVNLARDTGEVRWQKFYGGSDGQDTLRDLLVTPDGGVVMVGESGSTGGLGTTGNKTISRIQDGVDWWFVRTDASGEKIDEKVLGGSLHEAPFAIASMADGGFVLGGYSASGADGTKTSPNLGFDDAWMVRLGPSGVPQWDFVHGTNTTHDWFSSILVDEDDTLWALGSGYYDPSTWLIKVQEVEQPVGAPLVVVNGFYATNHVFASTNRIEITLSTSFPGGTILYSTDGTDPFGGTTYTAPFTVVQGATIRAIALNDDFTQSVEADPVSVQVVPVYPLTLMRAGGTAASVVNPSPVGGLYLSNSVVTLTAVAGGGEQFSHWSGDASGNALSTTVTLTAAKSVTANFFVIPYYTLTGTSDGGGSVALTPSGGAYLSNSVVTATATPSAGWSFMGWRGAASGAQNPVGVTVSGNLDVQAVFGTTLTTSVLGGAANGSVVLSPASGPYAYGSTVRVAGVPAAGKYFSAWGGALSGLNVSPASFVITNATPTISAIMATLSANNFALNVTIVGEGTVARSPQQGQYVSGSTVTLTAVPPTGTRFSGWSGDAGGTQNPLSVLMDSTKNVTATFVPVGAGEGNGGVRTIAIVGLSDGATFQAPASIQVGAEATAVAGKSIVRVELWEGVNKLGEDLTAPYEFSWSGVAAGIYVLTARAYDEAGGVVVSDRVRVEVTSPEVEANYLDLNDSADLSGWNFGLWEGAESAVTNGMLTAFSHGGAALSKVFNFRSKVGRVQMEWDGLIGTNNGVYLFAEMQRLGGDQSRLVFEHDFFGDSGTQAGLVQTGDPGFRSNFSFGHLGTNLHYTAIFKPDTMRFIAQAIPSGQLLWDVAATNRTVDLNLYSHFVLTALANAQGPVSMDNLYVRIQYEPTVDALAQNNTGGTVTRAPAKAAYDYGESVLLTAVPKRYYGFKEWSDGNGQNPRVITVGLTNRFVAIFTNAVPLEWQMAKQWEAAFGGSDIDDASTIRQTSDGGYVVGGTSVSPADGNKSSATLVPGWSDYWLLRLDAQGGKRWEEVFGGYPSSGLLSVEPTKDEGLLLGGWTYADVSGNKTTAAFGGEDGWVIKTDANGLKVWERTLGGSGDEEIYAAKQTFDGGYLIGGRSSSPVSGSKTTASFGGVDYWIVKLDANGNQQWEQTFGGDSGDSLASFVQTADAGFVLAGTSGGGISGNKTVTTQSGAGYWLIKVDSNGNKVWEREFGGADQDQLTSLQTTPDGGFLLGGSSSSLPGETKTSPSYGGFDYWVVKVDGNGDKQWERSYGGSGEDRLTSIHATPDGGFLLAGYSASAPSGSKRSGAYGGEDYWAIRIDGLGNQLAEQSFGGNLSDTLSSAIATSDGGSVLAGSSSSPVSGIKTAIRQGTNDIWVVKLLHMEQPVGTPLVLVNGEYAPTHSIPATNSVVVTMSTTFPGGYVFYTTDGTEPDSGSIEYTGAFSVTRDQIVRAVAYTSDFLTNRLADPVAISLVPVYSFTLLSTGGGIVTQDLAEGPVLSNSVVRITATPTNGWTFVGWAGDASGTQNPLSYAVTSNTTLQAVFGTALTVTTVGGGTVLTNPTKALYPFGSNIRLSAVPDAGKFFRFWSGAAAGLSNSPIVLVVTNPEPSVSAVFASLSAGAVALNTLVVGEGTVTKTPQLQNYANGAAVTLTASALPGSVFAGWSGDTIGTANPLGVSMTASKTITANFVAETQGVTIRSPVDGVELAAPAVLTIEAGLVDFAATRVEFFEDATKLGEATSSPYSVVWSSVPVGSYTLTARATDASGFSRTSPPVTVRVSAAPSIRTQPQSQTSTVGASVEFSVIVDGTPPFHYQWRSNNVDIPSATSSSYVLNTTSANLGTTSYTVTVTNSVGRVLSDVAVLTVSALPPQTIAFEPLPDRVLTNAAFALSATASSGLPVSFALVSGPARLTNGVLSLSGVGTVVVRAGQSGSASFAPASSVDRTFQVMLPGAPTETLDQGTTKAVLPYALEVSGLQYAIERGPATGTLSLDGNRFLYTPVPSFYGLVDFSYRITDTVSGVVTSGIVVNLVVRRVDPVFTLERSSYSAGEGDGFVTVTIRKNVSGEGRVLLSTRDVTATRAENGEGDYTLQQSFVDFASGETSRSVAISLIDDSVFEGNETFEFEISVISPASVTAPFKATVTIMENDSGLISTDTVASAALPGREARLQVNLNPSGVEGGWRFLGQSQWNASGVTSDGLPQGDYEVEFKPANGFAHPVPVVLSLTNGVTRSYAAYYTATLSPRSGNLTVTCAGTSLGGWKFVEEPDTAYRSSGTTLVGLNTGTYTIQFKPVDGLIAPGNLNAEVKSQTTQSYGGTYLVAPPSNTDRVKPSVTPLNLLKYPYVGQISRGDGELGTGFVVKDRVVLTAAHVLFDQRTLSAPRRVRWHYQKQRGSYEPKPQTPRGWNLYAGYAAQRTNEGVNSTSTAFSQNLDVAAMFFTESAGRGGYGGYLASTNNPNEWLSGADEKLISGYPINGIAAADQGKIHETSPVPVSLGKVAGLSDGMLYDSVQLLSYPGNSGGPLCVRYSNGKFYPAGVFVALDTERVYVRALDFKVVEMIVAAEVSARTGTDATGGGTIQLPTAFPETLDDTGFLQVTVGPQQAVDAGGGWRVVGGNPEYVSASSNLIQILTFGYELEFKPVVGFVTPPNVSVQVVGGATNVVVAHYTATSVDRVISGVVSYYNTGQRVPGVVVGLSGDATRTMTTGVDGTYSFTVPTGGNYTISPGRTTETPASHGVSTLDITLIRRHVLGIVLFDSAFKQLAADVNNSATITTLDITLIRRLILGLTDTLPSGLWRFVRSDQAFPDVGTPWAAEGRRVYSALASDASGQDFSVIKMGDVNASWTVPAAVPQGLGPLNSGAVGAGPYFHLPDLEVGAGPGQVVELPLTASAFRAVTSIQFSLGWDPGLLEFVSVAAGLLPGVSDGNFNLSSASQGQVSFSWDDPAGVGQALGEKEALFVLRFRTKTGRAALGAIEFVDRPTAREVSVNYQTVPWQGGGARVWAGIKRAEIRAGIERRGDDGLALVCPPLEGAIYVVQASDDLEAPVWRAIGEIQGDAVDRSIAVEAGATRSRFYRFLVRPKVLLSSPGALIEMR